MTPQKDKIDMLVDTLVHAQCFIDCLEYFEENEFEERHLFKFSLKKDVSKVIFQIRNAVNDIFHNVREPQGGQDIVKLYDVNYALHTELIKLDLNTKINLTKNIQNAVECILKKFNTKEYEK